MNFIEWLESSTNQLSTQPSATGKYYLAMHEIYFNGHEVPYLELIHSKAQKNLFR